MAAGLLGALFEWLEQSVRLLVNTLSFARVGAFALAHASLSLATVQLAATVPWRPGEIAILVLGNLIVLGLEGLIVSIQTTRLMLFEFFLRFLMRPLVLPKFG
jgi:V/A-type H+-transporting ATPase subunit I